jgi:CHASE3 domain sensor protein
METIRSKVISFFVICLAFAGLLTLLYYQNATSLRHKIVAIEQFDDLLNDVLELRRYEKNFILYRNASSIEEGLAYLEQVDSDYQMLKPDIVEIVGAAEGDAFSTTLSRYRKILDDFIGQDAASGSPDLEERLRSEGKNLVDFAQNLIQKKRGRIDQNLQRVLTINDRNLLFEEKYMPIFR